MPVDWSDDIVVVNLDDEPALSDELSSLIDRLEHRAEATANAQSGQTDSGGGAIDQSEPASSPDGSDAHTASSAGGVPHVVLDFSQVTYMSSSNIAQLLRLRTLVEDAGRSLMLCALNDDVWSVLLVTGLDKIFRFAPDPMTALAGLQIDHA